MEMPECGLTQEVLDDTDVLVWWAHVAHDQVPDEIAFRVRDAVWKGMGFIGLHSAHPSKPMQLLVGASGSLKWREGDRARVWCCNPTHPIAEGIPESFELENEEMYGEPFDIATPDELVFISWFAGGESIPAPAAAGTAGAARYSISSPVMKRSRAITCRKCAGSSRTPSAGQSLSAVWKRSNAPTQRFVLRTDIRSNAFQPQNAARPDSGAPRFLLCKHIDIRHRVQIQIAQLARHQVDKSPPSRSSLRCPCTAFSAGRIRRLPPFCRVFPAPSAKANSHSHAAGNRHARRAHVRRRRNRLIHQQIDHAAPRNDAAQSFASISMPC